MLRGRDLTQLENLYHHILTERRMYRGGRFLTENLMDDLAALKAADKTNADQVAAKTIAITNDNNFRAALQATIGNRPETRKKSEEDIYKIAGKLGRGGVANTTAVDEEGLASKQMLQVNVRQLNSLFDTVYRTNLQTGTAGMILYGASGIGKSDIIRQNAKKFAANENRTLVMWAHADREMREQVFNNPHNYYVVSIMNAGQIPAEKWVGIPDVMSQGDVIEERPFKDIAIFMLPGISGMLFLDELNHADPEKMNALFSVVLEKRAGNRALANNRLMICAAGNIGSGHHTMDVPKALVNRVSSYYLVVRPEDWFKWAESNNIHSTILAFVKSDPANNFYTKTTPRGKSSKLDTHVGFPCPRNFEMLSDTITPIYQKYTEGYYDEWAEEEGEGRSSEEYLFEELHRVAAGRMGSVWADYYISFLRYYGTYGDLDKLISLDSRQLSHYYAGLSEGNNVDQRDVLNIIAAMVHYLSSALVNAIIKSGMVDQRNMLRPEFNIKLQDPRNRDEVERAKQLIYSALSKSDDLAKVLNAIANVFKAVIETTTAANNASIETKELGTIVMNGVVSGFTSSQKDVYLAAVNTFAQRSPLIMNFKENMAKYVTDAGLQKKLTPTN